MAGFTRSELESFRDGSVPDLIGEEPQLLFVGINPGLWTVATQTHFCHPSNRFYPSLRRAGLIEWEVDGSAGMTDVQRKDFVGRGMGITNLVNRATVRASELTSQELIEGGERLAKLVDDLHPAVVAIAGITAYRTAFSVPKAGLGPQTDLVGGATAWAVPNPSGLNAHETVGSLAVWYGKAAGQAGLI